MEKKYTHDQIKDAIWQELKESDYAGENNERAYEVIGIVMAGVDRIVVSDVQPSAVWVKASEFDIKRNVVYHAIYEDKNQITKGSGFFNINDWFMWDNKEIEERYKDDWDKLLILDESGTAAVSQDAHEKEVMMQAFDKVRKLFEGREWIMEGRGSYPYNDDRYKEEVRYLYDEFDALQKDTWNSIESKSFEYRKAIIEEYVKGTAAGREDNAVTFAEWIDSIATRVSATQWRVGGGSIESIATTSELYEQFKNRNNENG